MSSTVGEKCGNRMLDQTRTHNSQVRNERLPKKYKTMTHLHQLNFQVSGYKQNKKLSIPTVFLSLSLVIHIKWKGRWAPIEHQSMKIQMLPRALINRNKSTVTKVYTQSNNNSCSDQIKQA